MGFEGPGTYEVVPYQAPGLDANSWGGTQKVGELVGTYTRSKPPTDNARWVVAQVAGTDKDSAEYIFINARNGYLLTAPQSPGDTSNISCQQRLPTDPLVRWKIKYSPANGYETYLVNGVNGSGQLNVRGAGTTSGVNIILWTNDNTDNARWYFDKA